MACKHLGQIKSELERENTHKAYVKGCEQCVKDGTRWVHLRECLECGHVGCCDSSVGKHATKHFHATKHAIMRSVEPGDTWGWCYVDKVKLGE
jgi:uncharacterized UBP type Zn finger protein